MKKQAWTNDEPKSIHMNPSKPASLCTALCSVINILESTHRSLEDCFNDSLVDFDAMKGTYTNMYLTHEIVKCEALSTRSN